ncbi:hypothetical protein [Pseudomonas brassicacearum]|uniref:Phage tail protein C-terminal domain-containing protein n=1 Tax=Pseudomonas brassicacearum TaxID=930166 RepID=A0A423GNV8_9PSED|nr:hypothetical protein [Pseudomonas brassicacearum]ROM94380.1 hypothetical protein BK658_17645 [Pseudomonas brassicacearum]
MPWYRDGKVTVTNGSTSVTGVGTDFASNSRVGDAFIGPNGALHEVTNVASATVLAIFPAYAGPTAAGASYTVAPIQGYVKQLADQAQSIIQQWGSTLAGLGSVSTENVVPVEKGGTGGKTQVTARSGLGLGTAATLNAGSAVGNAMLAGDRNSPLAATINTWGNSFQIWNNTTAGAPEINTSGTILNTAWIDGKYGAQILMSFTGRIFFRSGDYTSTLMREIYHTGNTTRGSGGALSAASPIVRIANVAASQRLDLQEQTFKPAGEWGVANSEAPGVAVERLGVGEYRVTGSLGLALEGWRTQDPCSPDGGRTLGITECQQVANGTIIIKLFKRRWTLSDDGEMIPGRGAALDVPLNSWIDVRLEMPKPEVLPIPLEKMTEI